MIETAYSYWTDHPQNKLDIGKNFGVSRPLKIVLILLEKIGLASLSETIYKKRFYQLLPRLNEHYLKTTYGLTESSPEFLAMKDSGRIPLKKAIWQVRESSQYLSRIHLLFEMRQCPYLAPQLSIRLRELLQQRPEQIENLENLTLRFSRYKEIRDQAVDKEAFDRICLLVKGENEWDALDFDLLEKVIGWLNTGAIFPHIDHESLNILIQKEQILREIPWIRLYITPDTHLHLTINTPLSRSIALEVARVHQVKALWRNSAITELQFKNILFCTTEKVKLGMLDSKRYDTIEKLVRWQQERILDLQNVWDDRHDFINFYIAVEDKFGPEGLKNFATLFSSHPFYSLDTLSFADKISFLYTSLATPEATPQNLLNLEEIVRLIRVESFKFLRVTLSSEFNLGIAEFLMGGLSKKTQAFTQDLQADSHLTLIDNTCLLIRQLKEELLIHPSQMNRFVEVVYSEIKATTKLPLDEKFKENVTTAILGKEYKSLLSIGAREYRGQLQKLGIIDQLSFLLPFSRNLPETKTLTYFYLHSLAKRTVVNDYRYDYSEEEEAFVNDLLSLAPIRRTPVSKDFLSSLEKLLLICLDKKFTNSLESATLISLLKRISFLSESLEQADGRALDTFHKELKETEDKRNFQNRDPSHLKNTFNLVFVKGMHAFCRTMILPREDSQLDDLDHHFAVLIDKFPSQEGFSTTLHKLIKLQPGHVLAWGLINLRKGIVQSIINESLNEIIDLIRTTLARIKYDVETQGFDEIDHIYTEDKFDHFLEGYILPVLKIYISLIQQARIDHVERDNGITPVNPPVIEFLLKNLWPLIEVFKLIEKFKTTGAFGSVLITRLSPLILPLFVPYFSRKEVNAATSLIGIITPYLIHRHNFQPLISYLIFLDKTIKKENASILTEEEKQNIIKETIILINWFVAQLLLYREGLDPFLEKLKTDLR